MILILMNVYLLVYLFEINNCRVAFHGFKKLTTKSQVIFKVRIGSKIQ